jgi:hypothetical protein
MPPARSMPTALAFLSAGLLCGCWPGPAPENEVLVSTTPPGASCTLTRLGRPIATAEPTPAIALVMPGDGPVTIVCRRTGFADAAATLPPLSVAGPSFGGMWYGNPDYDYERRVDIALVPKPSGEPR